MDTYQGCFSAWAGVIPAGIDGLDMAAEVGEAVGGLFGEAAHIGIDGGVAEVGAPGDAQATQRGQRVGDGREVVGGPVVDGGWVAGVGAGDGLGEEGGVGDGAGDGAIVGAGYPDVAIGPVGDAAKGGLESEDAAKGSGDADRAGAVGAMGERAKAGGHGRGRAAAGAARCAFGVPGIAAGGPSRLSHMSLWPRWGVLVLPVTMPPAPLTRPVTAPSKSAIWS